MRHRLGPTLCAPLVWATLTLTCTTAADGATTHLPAFVLRLSALIWAVVAWPRPVATAPLGQALVASALLVAYASGVYTGASWGLAVQPCATLLMGLAVWAALREAAPKTRQTAFDALILTGVMHSLWALCQVCGVLPGLEHRARGGFFSPIDMAAFLAPLVVWASFDAYEAQSVRRRRNAAVASGVLFLGLLATQSRGGILALCAAALSLCLSHAARQQARRLHKTAQGRIVLWGSGAASLCALGAAGFALRYRFSTAYDADAFSRLAIWRACWTLWTHAPFGLGTGKLEEAMRSLGIRTHGPVHFVHVANNAHNTFLQAMVELGFLGVLAWGAWLAGLVRGLCCAPLHKALRHRCMAMCLVLPALTATTLQLAIMALVTAVWSAEAFAQPSGALPPHLSFMSKPRPRPIDVPVRLGTRRLWGFAACGAILMMAPGAISAACVQRAQSALHKTPPDAVQARRFAAWASAISPWSLNMAMFALHTRADASRSADPLVDAEAFVTLAERYPSRPEPLREAALHLQAVARTPKQYSQVVTLWRLAAERDPHNALLWLAAADAAAHSHAPQEAQSLYRKTLEVEPNCAGAWLGLAVVAHDHHDKAARAEALGHVAQSLGLAQGVAGFGHAVLTLDEAAQLRFDTLMQQTQSESF